MGKTIDRYECEWCGRIEDFEKVDHTGENEKQYYKAEDQKGKWYKVGHGRYHSQQGPFCSAPCLMSWAFLKVAREE